MLFFGGFLWLPYLSSLASTKYLEQHFLVFSPDLDKGPFPEEVPGGEFFIY